MVPCDNYGPIKNRIAHWLYMSPTAKFSLDQHPIKQYNIKFIIISDILTKGPMYWPINRWKCMVGYSARWLLMPWYWSTRPSVSKIEKKKCPSCLTHWGRVTHICVSNVTIIGSDNGLSPGGRQAITWTNVGILLIGPLGTNFSEILIGIQTSSFKKMHLKMSSAKWRPFVLASMC